MGGQNKAAPSKKGGIYQISCIPTGKIYIGQTSQFGRRWSVHRTNLNAKKSGSPKLERAWHKYGESAFTFEVLEVIEDKDLRTKREQYYFDTLQPALNTSLIAGAPVRLGLKNSLKHRARISAAFERPESQAKLSARWKGKKQGAEHLAARAEAMRGNINSKGRVVTPEHRAKMTAGRRAVVAKKPVWTPEMRAKAAEAARKGHGARTPEERSSLASKAAKSKEAR